MFFLVSRRRQRKVDTNNLLLLDSKYRPTFLLLFFFNFFCDWEMYTERVNHLHRLTDKTTILILHFKGKH